MSGSIATPRGRDWMLVQYAVCDFCERNVERVVIETPSGVMRSLTEDGIWIHVDGRTACLV